MDLNLESFYHGKKVIITGHTGFKGSWLSIWLNKLGAIVTGIALDPVMANALFLTSGIGGKIKDYREDVRNLEKIKKIFQKEEPDIVFHLAAQALVLPSYRDPILTFETNIIGTLNILEACRNTRSVRQIIVVTTDKVYENKEQLTGYSEDDSLGGHDPYSASKAASEIVAQSFFRSFFNSENEYERKAMATVRAGNVIGGGDWAENRIIPDFIKSLKEGIPIEVRNPDAIRPWQHVLEPLSGYLHLAIQMNKDFRKFSGSWNFGPKEEYTIRVRDLVETVINYWGKGSWIYNKTDERLHETKILRLDIEKAKQILGWTPILTFDETIKWTVEWYRNCEIVDCYKLCIEQIEKYYDKWKLRSFN